MFKNSHFFIVTTIVVVAMFNLTFNAATAAESASKYVTVKPLPHSSGFFYQPVNRMQFVEDVWHFVIEINHGAVFEELDSLYKTSLDFYAFLRNATVEKECRNAQMAEKEIQSYLLNRIVALAGKHNDLDAKIPLAGSDQTRPEPRRLKHREKHGARKRRGAFNFIGNIDNYLFGLMDANDAEELHRVAKTSNSLNSQVKELTNEVIKIADYAEHINCLEKYRNDICIYTQAKIDLIRQQIQEIENIYILLDRSVDMAMDAHISSMIMTPQRLLDELKNVSESLPKSLMWPVELKLENMHNIINHQVVRTHVYITKQRTILFLLEVPLVNSQVYNVYKVVPIPYCGDKDKCAVIVPESQYLALSNNHRNYVRLDSLANVYEITPGVTLCYTPKIVHESSHASMCDIRILLNNDITDADVAQNCDVRVGKFDAQIFYPITEYNNWLYVLQKNTEMVINCNSGANIESLMLEAGAGLINGLNVGESCKLVTKKIELTLHQLKNNLYTNVYVPIATSLNISSALKGLDADLLNSMKSNGDLEHASLKGMTERLIDLRHRMDNNTVFSGRDIGDNNSSGGGGWFCWFASWVHVSCAAAEAVVACTIVGLLFLFVVRVYQCCCPGSLTALFSNCWCRSNTAATHTVIKTSNDQIQFLETARDNGGDGGGNIKFIKSNTRLPAIKYYVKEIDSNTDQDEVFLKN